METRQGTQLAVLQPTKICLPAGASPILKGLEQDLVTGRWEITNLPPATAEIKEAAQACIPRIETRLVPADREWAEGAVVTLLAHYYAADLPKHVHAELKADWMACVGHFPGWAIDQARVEWLKTGKRKPTPADIVERCNKAVAKERVTLAACKILLSKPTVEPVVELSAEERAANIAAVQKIVDGILGRSTRVENPEPERVG